MAAEAAVIDYDVEDLEPPILSVEDAVERSSFLEVPSFLYPKQVGNFSKGMAEADHKLFSAKVLFCISLWHYSLGKIFEFFALTLGKLETNGKILCPADSAGISVLLLHGEPECTCYT